MTNEPKCRVCGVSLHDHLGHEGLCRQVQRMKADSTRRHDKDGRDVTDLPGLWDESDRIVTAAELQAENDRLTGEIKGLRAAIQPFAGLARGIPDHWPGECKLRIDQRSDGSEYVCYHGLEWQDARLGILPTLDEWRRMAGGEEKDNGSP